MSALLGQQLGFQCSSLTGSSLQLRCRQPRVRLRGRPFACGLHVVALKQVMSGSVAAEFAVCSVANCPSVCAGPARVQPAHPSGNDRASITATFAPSPFPDTTATAGLLSEPPSVAAHARHLPDLATVAVLSSVRRLSSKDASDWPLHYESA